MPETPNTSAAVHVETHTQWGVQFDDGDVDAMWSRSGCVEAIAAMQRGIDAGHYDEADYAGRRIVKRTITTTTSEWEPA